MAVTLTSPAQFRPDTLLIAARVTTEVWMDYLVLKTVHILSSVVLVGTGFGTAFYLFAANRSGSVEAIAVVSRLVVRADWLFTTPAAIAQPITGFLLIHKSGFS